MDNRKQKPMIPIACRYIPYDRYFLTHGNPAWKVKHLKQRILARALSLPIDTRRLDPDYVYAPPSTSVSRRRTGTAAGKKPSREGFSASGGGGGGDSDYDDDDEPWKAKVEGRGRGGEHAKRRAPSPITFAGAEVHRDEDEEVGGGYLSAASGMSGGDGVGQDAERAASPLPSGSSSVSGEGPERRGGGPGGGGDGEGDDDDDGVKEPKSRRRGGSVSPMEFANPIVLRRQKSASMGAFLYEKGVEAGLVPPLPKSEKAKGKQKAREVEGDGDGEGEGDGDADEQIADHETGEGEGGGGDGEEVEAGYQVDDDDDSEDWSDDYDDEDMVSYLRSPKDLKEMNELPMDKPETPPPGGRILPGGDGTAVPSGGGPIPGGKIGTGGGGAGGGVHFAAPTTPRVGGKNKKRRKGASLVAPLSKIAKTVTGTSSHQPSHSISSSQSQSQSQPQHHHSRSEMVLYGPPPDPSEQILTLPFALVRFSTGQLLEDDLPLSWYDLRPYELLEVHFVLQPRRFDVSVRLGPILTRTVRGAPFSMGGGFSEADDGGRRRREKGMKGDPLEQLAQGFERERERDRRRDGFGGTAGADVPPRPEMFFHTETRELVPLPRGDVDAYVKPYWEGWARALRVIAPARDVNQHQQDVGLGYVQPGHARAGPSKYVYAPSYGAPHGPGNNNAKYAAAEHPGAVVMGGGGGAGMVVWDPAMNTYGEEKEREVDVDVDAMRGGGRPLSPSAGRHQQQPGHGFPPGHGPSNIRSGREKPKLEWRERWVVVRDGSIYLYKNRDDPSPTHQLALSALLSLKDAEHLAQHQHTKGRRDREAHSAVPPGGKTFSPERPQTSHGDELRKQRRRSISTPRPSTSGLVAGAQDYRLAPAVPGSSGVPPLPQGRVLDPEELEKKRKLDKDLEALTRWDDFGASFNFGKKDKGKDRVKGRDRGGEQQKVRGTQSSGKVGDGDEAEGWRRQKSIDVPRGGENHKREDRDWLTQEHGREEAEKDPRTYIPSSRDDAEAAGMKIICAKFRHRSSGPTPASSKVKRWYTSTGPSLAGESMHDAEATEHTRREEQTRVATAPQRPPTVPGRQTGLTVTGSLGVSSQASVSRSENIAPTSTATSTSKFGLSGLFGKDKDNDDQATRKEKEDKKREEKERKAREKEHKQLEKDRKKEDRRRREEEEFRGISSSSSNAWNIPVHPSVLHHLPRSDLGSVPSTPTMHPLESSSSITANSMALHKDDAPMTPRPEQSRPQLKISPISTRQNTWNKDFDDHDSDISFSSPVFAHSTESSEDDDLMLAKDRRGYRYGGYQAPASRKSSVANVASPVAEEALARVGTFVDKAEARGKEESINASGQGGSMRRVARPSADRERVERGEWLVLDLGSDSAFTSLLRIFHRQKPSVPSSFLPHAIATTLTPHSDNIETTANRHGSIPSSQITSQESGKDVSRDSIFNVSSQDDEAATPIHPEGLSTFMPHVSNRKATATLALPYPEWRTELVNYARFTGMREMDRPLHLAYTAWGRDKKAPIGEDPYSRRIKKSDSIWARRTRSSFVRTRTAETKQSFDLQDNPPTASEVAASLEPPNDEEEDDRGARKRMSLASHVSTIKANKSSASREEPIMDTLVPLPAENVDDQWKPGLADAGTVSSPESSGDETDGEVVLEVVSDEGFVYGRQDEEGAVAEALGWMSEDSDEEESEFEWAAWVTDLPRQHALSKQRKSEGERERKLIPQADQVRREESTPLSPMMFANPFVPDLAEPVMVYDTPRKSTSRPQTPPPQDPAEERARFLRDKRRWEPHATSVSEPLVHSHSNVSVTTLHLNHSSPSTSTLNQMRIPSRAPSSSQLSTQQPANPHPTLSSPSSVDSLADGQRQPTARFQGRSPSLNINPMQSARLRLQSNPTSPVDGAPSPTSPHAFERQASTQTFPRPRHQRQHSRSVSGGDGIFESTVAVEDQEMHRHTHQTASPLRGSGLHHSASMPSTRIASAPSRTPRTPHSVTFSSSYNEFGSGSFQPEPSMENMSDDGELSEHRQAIPFASSSRYAVHQSSPHYSGHPPSSPRTSIDLQGRASVKPSSSVLKKRRSDLGKGRVIDSETDFTPPLSPTLSEAGSTFGPMQGNYSTSRGPASNNFPGVAFAPGSASNTPLDKARALVRRVQSGSSLGGHEIQTVLEEHPQWESEAAGRQRDEQVGTSAGASMSSIMRDLPPNQPKKKKSAIDRLVRGFESSLDFMEGR